MTQKSFEMFCETKLETFAYVDQRFPKMLEAERNV